VGGGYADETFTGTYTVNADCTGTTTLQFFESGNLVRTSVLSIVFDNNQREIRMVQKSLTLPNSAALPVVITVEARRHHPDYASTRVVCWWSSCEELLRPVRIDGSAAWAGDAGVSISRCRCPASKATPSGISSSGVIVLVVVNLVGREPETVRLHTAMLEFQRCNSEATKSLRGMGTEPTSMGFGTEASPVGSPSPRLGLGGVGVVPSAKGDQRSARIRVGAYVQVAGRRGRFRVIGVTPHGVELRDRDERWHAVRPEMVRVVDQDSVQAGSRTTGQPRTKILDPQG